MATGLKLHAVLHGWGFTETSDPVCNSQKHGRTGRPIRKIWAKITRKSIKREAFRLINDSTLEQQ